MFVVKGAACILSAREEVDVAGEIAKVMGKFDGVRLSIQMTSDSNGGCMQHSLDYRPQITLNHGISIHMET